MHQCKAEEHMGRYMLKRIPAFTIVLLHSDSLHDGSAVKKESLTK